MPLPRSTGLSLCERTVSCPLGVSWEGNPGTARGMRSCVAAFLLVGAVLAAPALASAQDSGPAVDAAPAAAAFEPSALSDGVVADAPLPVEPKKRPTGRSAF